MAADINLLIPDFKDKVKTLLQNCKHRGIEMRPNEGVRDPFVQAKYWRQSRPSEAIQSQIKELKARGADFLAYCLEHVGPQHGDPVTNSIPGYSWHQWGEALDCIWVVNGKAVWDLKAKVHGLNGFAVYADEARKLGLDAGLLWSSFKDAPHVQLRPDADPSALYSITEIDAAMKKRFGK